MASRNYDMLDARAVELLSSMIESHDPCYGFGNMSCAVYDTAWVSMITKPVGAHLQWLSPESFQYVLDSQDASGGWNSDASEIDSILNTLAGLLALRKQAMTACVSDRDTRPKGLVTRMYKAATFLQEKLQTWDVASTIHVGFEILVPNLLDLLEKQGFVFEFPGRDLLMKIRHLKMTKIRPEMLYADTSVTAIHSLEAFINQIDFDRVAHHKIHGSMMASPSSTAAYLIHSSSWDYESEAYIRHVIASGPGRGDGSVPSAFPSTFFEISWILEILAKAGFDIRKLGGEHVHRFRELLQKGFDSGDGLIGFAPAVGTDADDTAKGIVAMAALGATISADRLVQKYEQPDCFKTYSSERHPSFSTNCNVLTALLHATEPAKYGLQIEKIVRYISATWRRSHGGILDKWNLSPYYPVMLMSQSLMEVITIWDEGRLPSLPDDLMKGEVLVILWQALTTTLQDQNTNGSWGAPQSREGSAYAILAVNALASLPAASIIRNCVDKALESGRSFLMQTVQDSLAPENLWIEKVTYGSRTLSSAYTLAAIRCSPSCHLSSRLSNFEVGTAGKSKANNIYKRMPMFSSIPEWRIQAWQNEAQYFATWLKRTKNDIFPGMGQRENKYTVFIAFTWIAGNDLVQPRPLASDVMSKMMMLSLLIYHMDEYMEDVVASQPRASLSEIKDSVKSIFDAVDLEDNHQALEHMANGDAKLRGSKRDVNGDLKSMCSKREPNGDVNSFGGTAEIAQTLTRFLHWVLQHPEVKNASTYDRRQLCGNIKAFLIAHLTQIEDNHQLRSKQRDHPVETHTGSTKETSFFTWVRSTSADHTGGPFAFHFFLLLVENANQKPRFPTCEAKFIAEDVSRHSATLCRIYNDLGSVLRDRREANLNSVDFPEFQVSSKLGESEDSMKVDLLRVAEYERKCLDGALAALRGVCEERLWRAVKVFCDVTDLYGQMYMLEDLTPYIREQGQKSNGK